MNKLDTISIDYKYGIFAKIRKGWTVPQVKMYMDNNDIPYEKNDKMEQLVERLEKHEDSKYE